MNEKITTEQKDTTRSISPCAKKVSFLVTGFGPFQGVPTNPTTTIVERLKPFLNQYDDEKRGALSSSDVELITLETSASDVRKKMDEFFCDLIQNDVPHGSEDDDLPPNTTNTTMTNGHLPTRDTTNFGCRKTRCSNFVIIHLGVSLSSSCVKLETRAYNEATFRVPDEDGYRPSEVCIDPSQSLGTFLSSTLDLDWVCTDVNRRMSCGKSNGGVQLSSDAGRFVCNYTYWYSLNRARHNIVTDVCNNGGLDVTDPRIDVVFVHVPPFDVQSVDHQMEIVVQLINSIRQSILDKSNRIFITCEV